MIRAILIGVEHYPSASTAWDLDGPARDVLRVLTYLRSRGVPRNEICCLVSALPRNADTAKAIHAGAAEQDAPTEEALNRLFENVLPGQATDTLFLYWSGHGFMEKDGQRRLFTADARPELKKNVNLDSLLRSLDSSTFKNIKRVDAIIDACANYIAATAAGITDRSFAVGTRNAEGELRILCAASAGEFARNVHGGDTGVFTTELMAMAERAPLADGSLFDFRTLAPALRERFAKLRREDSARQAPNLIWVRASGTDETAPLPEVDRGDLFLSRLGVFEDSFSFLGCIAVYPRSRTLEVEAQIQRLRTNELLVQHETFPRRYCLTPNARASAIVRLDVLGEAEATRDKHARHYAQLARTHERWLRQPARRGSLDMLEQELPNILKALEWCETQPELVEDGLELAAGLFWFWNLTGRFELAADWLRRLLEKGMGAPQASQARARYAAGALAFMMGDYEQACDLLDQAKDFWAAQAEGEERDLRLAYTQVVLCRAKQTTAAAIKEAEAALDLFRVRGDRWGQALALNDLGYVFARARRWNEAGTALTASLSLWRALSDAWGTPLTLNNLGMVQLQEHKAGKARDSHEEALQLQLEEGDVWGAAESLKFLGELALDREDLAEARACFKASLARLAEAPRPQLQVDCLLGLARWAAAARPLTNGCAVAGARALATWEVETQKAGLVLPPHHRDLADELDRRLRTQLGGRYSTERAIGRKMSLADALMAVTSS